MIDPEYCPKECQYKELRAENERLVAALQDIATYPQAARQDDLEDAVRGAIQVAIERHAALRTDGILVDEILRAVSKSLRSALRAALASALHTEH